MLPTGSPACGNVQAKMPAGKRAEIEACLRAEAGKADASAAAVKTDASAAAVKANASAAAVKTDASRDAAKAKK